MNFPPAQGVLPTKLDEHMARVASVPGDFAEFGVYEGGITLLMAKFGRRVWAFDTYDGIPVEEYIEELDSSDPPGKWKPTIDVMAAFEEFGNGLVTPVVGRFEETLPRFTEDIRLAFVHLDCDNYHAYRTALAWIAPRLSPGAVVVSDDYGNCAGATKAMDEFMSEGGIKFTADSWFTWGVG